MGGAADATPVRQDRMAGQNRVYFQGLLAGWQPRDRGWACSRYCARPIPTTFYSAVRSRRGDGRARYSAKHRRHRVNVHLVTDLRGQLLWISPALPSRVHDLTGARTHQIVRICERQGIPVLSDLAYMGADPWGTTPLRRPPGIGLTPIQQTVALTAAPTPVERGVARLKSWRIFRRARCSPNLVSSIAAAVLTLERLR